MSAARIAEIIWQGHEVDKNTVDRAKETNDTVGKEKGCG
jgi:hypothetical protein